MSKTHYLDDEIAESTRQGEQVIRARCQLFVPHKRIRDPRDEAATCKRCASSEQTRGYMRVIHENRAAINSAAGPLCPPDLGKQVAAYNRGATTERARILAIAREMAAEHDLAMRDDAGHAFARDALLRLVERAEGTGG